MSSQLSERIKYFYIGISLTWFQGIPSTGLDKWFGLEGRSARSNVQGQIRLQMHLATREDRGIDEEDNWTDIKQHEDLLSIFIEHEIRKFRVRHRVRRGVFYSYILPHLMKQCLIVKIYLCLVHLIH